MGGDTVFCRPVHFKSTDLNFKGLAVRTDQCGVERLIHVRLRHGDVVLETSGNGLIHFMYDPQRCVTVLHRIYNDPDCKQIVDLIQGLILINHLFIDTEEMFDPAVDLGMDPGVIDMLPDLSDNLIDERLTFASLQIDLFHQIIIDFRFQIFQRKIIQFDLYLGNTQPLSDGCVDIHGLPGFFFLFGRGHIFQSPHIVKPVCQFDKNDPDILGHSQEHLS